MSRRPKTEPGWHRRLRVVRPALERLPDSLKGSGGVWAIGLVRDEADIIEPVLENFLRQGVERIVVADNMSTDGTEKVLEEFSRDRPVTVVRDHLETHHQAEKITLLARGAAKAGAGWIIPFDADELWLSAAGTLSDWLGHCDLDVVQVPVYNHLPTASDDRSEPDPIRRLRWRKEQPNSLHKVAFRPRRRFRVLSGNHGVTRRGRRGKGLEIRHYPYRSQEQFIRKMAHGSRALASSDLSSEVGKHWRAYDAADEESLKDAWRSLVETHNLPSEWWVPRGDLVEDPAPGSGASAVQ